MGLQILYVVIGLVVLTLGADYLVTGASRLARLLRVSPLLIGLTIVAFGTSAPELVSSITAAMRGQSEMAVGNVIGSNIFNIFGILGLCALVRPLLLSERIVKIEIPIMIGVTMLALFAIYDGVLGHGEGVVALVLLGLYVLFQVRTSKGEHNPEFDKEFSELKVLIGSAKNRKMLWYVGYMVVGLVGLVFGAQLLIDNAVGLAQHWGISERIVGLTLVAAGTSVPELATSLVATYRGERDIAIGNVVGSNIFNLLGVMGISTFFSKSGLEVSGDMAKIDGTMMLVSAFFMLPFAFHRQKLYRWGGVLYLFLQAAYVFFLVRV